MASCVFSCSSPRFISEASDKSLSRIVFYYSQEQYAKTAVLNDDVHACDLKINGRYYTECIGKPPYASNYADAVMVFDTMMPIDDNGFPLFPWDKFEVLNCNN